MRLLHAVAFPLDWRAGSVANASAHLEGPELVLTCHILQGKPGNRKKAREKSPQQRSCSLWKQGCFMLYSLGQKWRRRTQMGIVVLCGFFFSPHFTHSVVFLNSVSWTFLLSFSPTFLDSTFLFYCCSDSYFASVHTLFLYSASRTLVVSSSFSFTLFLRDNIFLLVCPAVCMRSC